MIATNMPSERALTNAILLTWLEGASDSPELAEWWQTREAQDVAEGMARSILQHLEDEA